MAILMVKLIEYHWDEKTGTCWDIQTDTQVDLHIKSKLILMKQLIRVLQLYLLKDLIINGCMDIIFSDDIRGMVLVGN